MRSSTFFSLLVVGICSTAALSPDHVNRVRPEALRPRAADAGYDAPIKKRDSPYLNANTEKFVVDGTGLPDVDFDIGESYAGLLPISSAANETRQLFFWFFPSPNPAASNEVTVWFTGGPGCSGLIGLLQENGPFLWEFGSFLPTQNPYSWSNLTNMLYIEQPIGVGFTQGVPDITDEDGLSRQFIGFYKNFEAAFGLQDRDVYITGESYGGVYVSYVSNAMLDAGFNVKGAMMYSPLIGDQSIQFSVAEVPFLNYWDNVFALNSTFMDELEAADVACGYAAYRDEFFTFPPPGPFDPSPNASVPGCDLRDDIADAAALVNPCWNFYHVLSTCPFPWSALGDGNGGIQPPGADVYFNRSDVQKAINAPPTDWSQCTLANVFPGPDGQNPGDESDAPALNGVLQRLIERTNNTIIGNGLVDFVVVANGTLLQLQNTTWNGLQGFQAPPDNEFFVPYHPEFNPLAMGGAGFVGHYGTERGLTFVTVDLAGHGLPQWHASAAYRTLELLLGRIDNLGEMGDFTTQTGNFTGSTPLL